MKRIEHHACFGGRQEVWRHQSHITGAVMNIGIYLPPQALIGAPCPVLYWLSGLTCTEQNFITKAGAQQFAARHGIILVAPDTSPRGDDVPDAPDDDLGQGAGFYVNATQPPWNRHYRMYDYITEELPALVQTHFPASEAHSIFGHSMGGHGALVAALRNPGRYRSVSAFAPIVSPTQAPWGVKAFRTYLGDNASAWKHWDSVALIQLLADQKQSGSAPPPILIDQGSDDPFLTAQLCPERLQAACSAAGYPLELRLRPGYDHSYYFIASFIGEHIDWHAQALAMPSAA